MGSLYHVSECDGIAMFEPRAPQPGAAPVVWAIDEEHLPNYLLPRDCPRVTFFADETTTPEDSERFLMSARRVVAFESGWLDRVRAARLCLYRFSPEGFELTDRVAGYFLSHVAVRPEEEAVVDDCLKELGRRDVEVRIMPSLWELRERVVNSTLGFSVIRRRNAAPRAG